MSERHLAIINPYQARPIRDQQVLAGRAVIGRLRHLDGDLPRQVRPDSVMRAAG
jgi:hypothetical protein